MAGRAKRRKIQEMKRVIKKKIRPKTFKSEEAANTWAKVKNVINYTLVNMKNKEAKTKKIKIVANKLK